MQNTIPRIMPPEAIAIIGAGPAGLVAARWLIEHGFEPVLFEASARLGGQWNGENEMSATWPAMRTNTSRVMTAFSDLDHPDGTATYPRRDDMRTYLESYAHNFDIHRRIRFASRVELLDRVSENNWLVRSTTRGSEIAEIYGRVVIATGRNSKPRLPAIPGMETFTGELGLQHTAGYDGVEAYRGKSVLVGGCSISALEIASELALGGAADVIASYRRQRYVLPKLIAGVPTEHVLFTRASAIAGQMLPPDLLAAGMKAKLLSIAGNPAQFGALAPDENIFAAGITQSQDFLPAVASGRIAVRPWIERIDGRVVHFADGTQATPDAILLGTGYDLSLPWLSEDIARILDNDGQNIDLYDHTFHPDLPGLAFAGLYDLVGPYFTVLELQARWIAYSQAGILPMPSRQDMVEAIAQNRMRRGGPSSIPMSDMALLFARNAQVEPSLKHWPQLERALLAGPLSPASFRLEGLDALKDAARKTLAAAAAFGAITGPDFTDEEAAMRRMIMEGAQAA